ncbi:MAG: hypothetical protein KME06_15055 [Kastovskya adunca ATA6-11-RM4]|nr:hypothetical protein [Kastovskya adunca ATA6-11-RM4]
MTAAKPRQETPSTVVVIEGSNFGSNRGNPKFYFRVYLPVSNPEVTRA